MRGLYVSAKFGVTKNVEAPKQMLFPCPLKRKDFFLPSVPGTFAVLRSSDRIAVRTLAGISLRAAAVPIRVQTKTQLDRPEEIVRVKIHSFVPKHIAGAGNI